MAEVRLIARIVAKPGKRDALRELLIGLVRSTRTEPGVGTYELYESDTSGRFIFNEIWPSQAALDQHMKTPHFKALEAHVAEMVEGTPELNKLTRLEP